MALTKLVSMAGLWSVGGSSISLPFEDGKVSMGLDGQSTKVRIDSGSARFFVVYGPEYEKRNKSCNDIKVCYFCPPNHPCDDILERKNWTVFFGDGDVYTYVEHIVSLNLGDIVIPEVSIGLVINFYNIHDRDSPPDGFLGLSHGRIGIPETFLEQLRRLSLISSLSYSILTNGDAPNYNGVIMFDDSTGLDDSFVRIKGVKNQLAVDTWSMQLESADGRKLARPYDGGKVKKDKSVAVIFDSGATDIYLTESEFDVFIDGCRGNVWFDEDSDFYVVEEKNIHKLPTLVFYIGEKNRRTEIRIGPIHYLQVCQDLLCVVGVHPSPIRDATFGHPFFYAYDVGFDISTEETVIFIRKNTRVDGHEGEGVGELLKRNKDKS